MLELGVELGKVKSGGLNLGGSGLGGRVRRVGVGELGRGVGSGAG